MPVFFVGENIMKCDILDHFLSYNFFTKLQSHRQNIDLIHFIIVSRRVFEIGICGGQDERVLKKGCGYTAQI